MLTRKKAKVIEGKYCEWEENEGPAHPITNEFSLNPRFENKIPTIKLVSDLSLFKPSGLRIA